MSETIHDVLYWEITNLVQQIKDAFPNHNQLPWVDAAICKLIDARKDLSKQENIDLNLSELLQT